jgi:hypothetical protein
MPTLKYRDPITYTWQEVPFLGSPGPQGLQGPQGGPGPQGPQGPTGNVPDVLGTSYVATQETTANTVGGVDLATPQSVTFSLTQTTDVWITLTCEATCDTANAEPRIYAEVDTVDRQMASSIIDPVGAFVSLAGSMLVSLSAGSHTIKMQYGTNAGNATFSIRSMIVRRLDSLMPQPVKAPQVLGNSYVSATENTSSTTPVELATAQQVTFTLDTPTDVWIDVGASGSVTITDQTINLWVDVDATVGQIAAATVQPANGFVTLAGSVKVSLAVGSHVIKLKVSTQSGTAAFTGRSMIVRRAGVSEVPSGRGSHNLLANGGAWFWARQDTPTSGTTYNDDTYFADRWYILGEGAVLCNQTSGNMSPFALRLTQNNFGSYRIGCAQIVENVNAYPFRSKPVTLQFFAKVAGAALPQTVRYAILEWTGAADVVTSDVVNNWASTTFTPGNFFISNVVVTAITTTPVYTNYTFCTVSGTVSSAMNNLIVMIWTDQQFGISSSLTLSDLILSHGTSVKAWNPDPYEIEETKCVRYCRRYTSQVLGVTYNANTLLNYGVMQWNPPMRVAPTFVKGTYTVNAGNPGTVTATAQSTTGIAFNNNSGAGWTTSAIVWINNMVLDAEL